MVGSVEDADELSVNLRACFSHEVRVLLLEQAASDTVRLTAFFTIIKCFIDLLVLYIADRHVTS
jgi:hypothetical protein